MSDEHKAFNDAIDRAIERVAWQIIPAPTNGKLHHGIKRVELHINGALYRTYHCNAWAGDVMYELEEACKRHPEAWNDYYICDFVWHQGAGYSTSVLASGGLDLNRNLYQQPFDKDWRI